ncbi:hypothetical protein GYMLUDRAFT_51239 [Collybiopsis luxurians FD-317 M1]|uniref:Unplaced genomic scaffold GYMLUscaffold_158, whole genome shotgun sequence n=1 Tax=Collybiopsis luxurians FD-317 M1 TaxID=944289 RepID=A0A0D0BLV5_9AGAR|nr:hypothetical protein GYMLUDRAFT_51239 [Collybiopsis luxurians FD-317 M1]
MPDMLPVGAYLWGNVEYLSFADPSSTGPFARFDAISMRPIKRSIQSDQKRNTHL